MGNLYKKRMEIIQKNNVIHVINICFKVTISKFMTKRNFDEQLDIINTVGT